MNAVPAILPACATEQASRGHHLLRACGFILRKNLFSCALALLLPLWWPAHAFRTLFVAIFFFQTTSLAFSFVHTARRCLPLGNRRASMFLWCWQVPFSPVLGLLASACSLLWHDAPGFRDAAQHGLWAAGVLALLSLIQTLLGGDRPPIRWIRTVLWMSSASLFLLYHVPSPVAAMVATAKYNMTLTWVAALLIPLSFWALRCSSCEDLLREMPLTPRAAARELDGSGGWALLLLSILDGATPGNWTPRHWLLQVLVRCLFSYQNLFLLTIALALHYGLAIPAWKRDSLAHFAFVVVAFEALHLLDHRTLRRLPLSALSVTSVPALVSLCVVSLVILPQMVLQRIPGSLRIEFTFSNAFTMPTICLLWVQAALVMGVWTLQLCIRGRLSMSDRNRGHWWLDGPAAMVIIGIADVFLAELSKEFGWRSDLLLGSLVLFPSMALHYGLTRWGNATRPPACT